jgi:hypothetical protein
MRREDTRRVAPLPDIIDVTRVSRADRIARFVATRACRKHRRINREGWPSSLRQRS